jgi:hypothetical protein
MPGGASVAAWPSWSKTRRSGLGTLPSRPAVPPRCGRGVGGGGPPRARPGRPGRGRRAAGAGPGADAARGRRGTPATKRRGGRVPAQDLMSEAVQLEDLAMREGPGSQTTVFTASRTCHGLQLLWADELEAAREVLHREPTEYERWDGTSSRTSSSATWPRWSAGWGTGAGPHAVPEGAGRGAHRRRGCGSFGRRGRAPPMPAERGPPRRDLPSGGARVPRTLPVTSTATRTVSPRNRRRRRAARRAAMLPPSPEPARLPRTHQRRIVQPAATARARPAGPSPCGISGRSSPR